jgi:hypothetical protein
MKYKKIILLICLLSLIPASAQQEIEGREDTNEREQEKRHSLAFVFGYTHIPGAKQDGKTEEDVFLPTLGLDYLYEFREKWFIGAAFDVELGKYEIDYEDDEISREIAVVFSGLVGYDVLPGWAVLAGPGIELEKNKNIFVFRFSTEYTFELGNDWGIYPNFTYDFKKEYGSFELGVGLKKRF